MSIAVSFVELPLCTSCVQNLEHCHATLVVHLSGELECTDGPSCRLAEDVHEFIIGCDETNATCC